MIRVIRRAYWRYRVAMLFFAKGGWTLLDAWAYSGRMIEYFDGGYDPVAAVHEDASYW